MSRFPSGSRNWTKATLPMSTTSEASSAPRSRKCATTAPRSSAHQKKRGGPSGVNGAFASRARPGPGSIGTSTIVSSCEGRDTSAPSSLPYQSAERWMSRTGMKTWPISRRIGVVTAQSYDNASPGSTRRVVIQLSTDTSGLGRSWTRAATR